MKHRRKFAMARMKARFVANFRISRDEWSTQARCDVINYLEGGRNYLAFVGHSVVAFVIQGISM